MMYSTFPLQRGAFVGCGFQFFMPGNVAFSSQLTGASSHSSRNRWRASGLGFVRQQVRLEDQLRPVSFKVPGGGRPLALFQAINRASTF